MYAYSDYKHVTIYPDKTLLLLRLPRKIMNYDLLFDLYALT